jgi:hypothetical protein
MGLATTIFIALHILPILVFAYQQLTSPLRNVPGPLLTRFTRFGTSPKFSAVTSKKHLSTCTQNMEK